MAINWETSQFLNDLKLGYVEQKVAVADIDWEESTRNQVRAHANVINEAQVENYALEMRKGAQFPPIIVARKRGKQLVIIDGNHRTAATMRNGESHIDAIVVSDPSDAQFDAIAYWRNNVNGLPLDASDRMARAFRLVRSLGMSIMNAAAACNVSEASLKHRIAAQETAERCALLGAPVPDAMTSRMLLRSIKNDQAFVGLCEIADIVGSASLASIVAEVNAQRTDAKRLAIVDAAKAEVESRVAAAAGRDDAYKASMPINKALRAAASARRVGEPALASASKEVRIKWADEFDDLSKWAASFAAACRM